MRIFVALLMLVIIAEVVVAQDYRRKNPSRRTRNGLSSYRSHPLVLSSHSGAKPDQSWRHSELPVTGHNTLATSSDRFRETHPRVEASRRNIPKVNGNRNRGIKTLYPDPKSWIGKKKVVETRYHKTKKNETEKYVPTEATTDSPRPIQENKRPGNDSLSDDKCGDFSIRFQDDGECHPLLKKGPCPSLYHWVTVDPYSLKGICTQRLCGRNRVFVERDNKCHDINDRDGCRGGRRLYYNAYGETICDCPVGQYPFPNEGDDCVPILTQGPCPDDHVVTPTSSGELKCEPQYCPANSELESFENLILQFVPIKKDDDTKCFALGTKGPCCADSDFVGYDIFKVKGECVDLKNPSSPYFTSSDEEALLDDIFEGTEVTETVETNSSITITRADRVRRQGIIKVPGQTPNSLLNPCQQGGRAANNLKCANPLVPGVGATGGRPVSPTCPPGQVFVAATRQCRVALG